MTKVINDAYEFQVLQAQSSLLKLRSLFRQEATGLYGGTKVYRFAVARRYGVLYFAFLNYLLSRLSLKKSLSAWKILSIVVADAMCLLLTMSVWSFR